MPTERLRDLEAPTTHPIEYEAVPEHPEVPGRKEEAERPAAQPTPRRTAKPAGAHRPEPDRSTVREVETILEDGLQELYLAMDEVTRREFKAEGETAATRINGLLSETKIHVQRILRLIVHWLRLIPGVSRIFIEQEAKIKMDRLLTMRQKKEEDS